MQKIKPYLAFSSYNLKKALSVMNKNGKKCSVIVEGKYSTSKVKNVFFKIDL